MQPDQNVYLSPFFFLFFFFLWFLLLSKCERRRPESQSASKLGKNRSHTATAPSSGLNSAAELQKRVEEKKRQES